MLDINYFSGLDVEYHDAGEREIRAVVMYVNATKLYVDAAHETEAIYADVVYLCKKGFLRIFDTDTYYAVASFKDTADTSIVVTYGTGSTPKTVTVSVAAAASLSAEPEMGLEA